MLVCVFSWDSKATPHEKYGKYWMEGLANPASIGNILEYCWPLQVLEKYMESFPGALTRTWADAQQLELRKVLCADLRVPAKDSHDPSLHTPGRRKVGSIQIKEQEQNAGSQDQNAGSK